MLEHQVAVLSGLHRERRVHFEHERHAQPARQLDASVAKERVAFIDEMRRELRERGRQRALEAL
jgi:hypothetical protein